MSSVQFAKAPASCTRIPIATWPEDSWLTDYLEFGRKYSEASDEALVGCILPVVGAILGRSIWVDFGGHKYPNVYVNLASNPGFRKSTTMGLAERMAREILPARKFTSGTASEEALFTEYSEEDGGDPDKLLIQDEGNTILANWANTSYGKVVAKRYLTLYDCKPFQVAFQKNLKSGDSVVKRIDETSTNILMGATLNVANFHGLESADGMRRRFLTYLIRDFERVIYFPESLDSGEFEELWRQLAEIPNKVAGRVEFTDCGREAFIKIQDRNRAKLRALPSNAGAAESGLLAEEVSFTLKVAMIFQALRVISPNSPNSPSAWAPMKLDKEVLKWANLHVQNRLTDARELDSLGKHDELLRNCELVHSVVVNEFSKKRLDGDVIILTRSDLTTRFCNNPSRNSSLSPSLYTQVIPELIRQGLCAELPKEGRLQRYAFKPDDFE